MTNWSAFEHAWLEKLKLINQFSLAASLITFLITGATGWWWSKQRGLPAFSLRWTSDLTNLGVTGKQLFSWCVNGVSISPAWLLSIVFFGNLVVNTRSLLRTLTLLHQRCFEIVLFCRKRLGRALILLDWLCMHEFRQTDVLALRTYCYAWNCRIHVWHGRSSIVLLNEKCHMFAGVDLDLIYLEYFFLYP